MASDSDSDTYQQTGKLDKDPSQLSFDDVSQALGTPLGRGLSSEEAARRLEKFGPNKLASKKAEPKWKKFLRQFEDPLVYLLIAATIISFITWVVQNNQPHAEHEAVPVDALVIIVVLIVNAVLGYLQESKAEEAVDALAKMTQPTASVLRDGQVQRINTTDIVPGDVLVLAEGDTVPADGRLYQTASLRMSEASLTGESVPVAKSTAPLASVKALGDRTNMIFNGTAVTQGTGRAIVTSTGMHTQVGKIADMLSATDSNSKTPLQKEMAQVSKVLGIAVIAICVVVIIALWLSQGFHSFEDGINALLLAVSLAVAAVPEGLATILTIVLALGVQRMAQHHAIVTKLSSVETLGSASVICSDKTGTLTRNEMTVETVLSPSGRTRLTGSGYDPSGQLTDDEGHEIPSDDPLRHEARVVLGVGALANDGHLVHTDKGTWECEGDPTEVSVIVGARKIGAYRGGSQRYTRVGEIPFTSERKRQTVIMRDNATGFLRLFAKGAPDVLLNYCDRIAVAGQVRPMTDGDRATILQQVADLSSQAYRTLGMAYRPLNGIERVAQIPGIRSNAAGDAGEVSEQADTIEQKFVWGGMVGIIDPPRTEVRPAVAQAHHAGIRTVMITGDHPLTAARIAGDLGIARKGEKAVTGSELDQLSGKKLDETIATHSVYARVAPEHKLIIVKSLQKQGNIVAMTGDGVNDAPAVKSADIGVAMGITGTEVTKQSAKMILQDDNFATIVEAVKEGRGIFENIKKFLRFLLSSNMGEVFTVFFGVLLAGWIGLRQEASGSGIVVPLLAVQLLWINLLTDAAPALAMGMDQESDDVLNRPPRKLTDRVIDGEMWGDIFFVGFIMAFITLFGMDLYLPGGLINDYAFNPSAKSYDLTMARTMGFTILVFTELFNALASRSGEESAFKHMFTNKWLWGSLGLSLVLQLVVIYVPFLNTAFGTVPLPWHSWFEALALSSVTLWATEIRKIFLRMRTKRRLARAAAGTQAK
jgi:Ca2+-transporting ATPase